MQTRAHAHLTLYHISGLRNNMAPWATGPDYAVWDHNSIYKGTLGTTKTRCLLLKASLNVSYRCDYSWHGTTPGTQRSWAESRRLLLARSYADMS